MKEKDMIKKWKDINIEDWSGVTSDEYKEFQRNYERFDSYIDTGKKLELIDDVNIKQYDLWINNVTERAKKYDIELNIDI